MRLNRCRHPRQHRGHVRYRSERQHPPAQPIPEEVISSDNNSRWTPNTNGDTLPPTAPECLEARKKSGLWRSLGRRVLGCLRPERQQTEDTDARTSTPQPLSESVDDARSLEGGGDVARETLCCERIGETPMPTETLDRVTEEPGTVFNDTNDGQALLTRGPRSGLGNRWFNAQPSLKIEVLVGLPNSYSDLWVNIPDVIPPSAEDVECQQRGYAQETRLIRSF